MIKAYKEAFTSANISSGFQRAGIVPFVPMNVLIKCNDLNEQVYTNYVPNDDCLEEPWTNLLKDITMPNSLESIDSSEEEEDSLIKEIDTDHTTYSQELVKLLNYVPPTIEYKNKEAADTRINTFNKVINKSDLYSILESKQAKRKEQSDKKEHNKIKKEHKIKGSK